MNVAERLHVGDGKADVSQGWGGNKGTTERGVLGRGACVSQRLDLLSQSSDFIVEALILFLGIGEWGLHICAWCIFKMHR